MALFRKSHGRLLPDSRPVTKDHSRNVDISYVNWTTLTLATSTHGDRTTYKRNMFMH